ncbi:hypothetical protein SDC9_83690 [bioreactor metagenome]|uniref:Uncharacterized protein n=1 Tax=bioreactor metagenome TaxID=1076179 RepID=A0A644ZGX2_9ZZZZ
MSYLLNKDVFFGDAKAVAGMALSGEAGDGESGGFLWGQSLPWSRSLALVSYVRPEQVSQPVADDALLPAARENLAVILQYVQAHPDMEFTFYLVPYSILFWDQTIRTGRLDAVLAMHKLVLEALTALPNARVFYFLDSYDIITDLDNYGDHIHFSPHISALLAERMAAEAPMEASEISARLTALRVFAEGYDYEAIFAG